jgi:small subunit ribosomal protein S9
MNSETTKFYGIGRRKESVAQALLINGTGNITINNKNAKEYLQNNESRFLRINQPLLSLNIANNFDITIKAKGGGIAGQTDAICLAISRALIDYDSNYRTPLKQGRLLTRDARIKERKKYGLKKARKASQFSKR